VLLHEVKKLLIRLIVNRRNRLIVTVLSRTPLRRVQGYYPFFVSALGGGWGVFGRCECEMKIIENE
jgi:hypothetical protein